MMKKIPFLFLFFLWVLNLNAQSGLPSSVLYQYADKPNSNAPSHNLAIVFYSGFDDTVEIYINNKLEKRKHLKTNDVSSYTGDYITVNVSRNAPPQLLRIKTKDAKEYLEVILDWRYKVLNISKSPWNGEARWLITYKNNVTKLE